VGIVEAYTLPHFYPKTRSIFMKLTAYRLTVLVLTNALTGLLAFAVGGAYGTRIEQRKKNEEEPKASPEIRVVPDGFMPSTIKEDLERGVFNPGSST